MNQTETFGEEIIRSGSRPMIPSPILIKRVTELLFALIVVTLLLIAWMIGYD